MITGVGSIPVPVTDLDRALRFYRDTLGFVVREDRRMPDGTRRVAVAPAGAGPDVTLTLAEKSQANAKALAAIAAAAQPSPVTTALAKAAKTLMTDTAGLEQVRAAREQCLVTAAGRKDP